MNARFAEAALWPIERIKLNPRNARIHSPEQIDLIRRSLREYGWTRSIVVDEHGLLLAGHGALEAAKAEGFTQALVSVASGLSDAQKRAYALADNRIAEASTWDLDILKGELGVLQGAGLDLGLAGFPGLLDLNNPLADPALSNRYDPAAADANVPEPPKNPASRPGDLWLLGEHRLLCGDATNAEHVARLLDGAKPHLMVTDPPYGVSYDPNWRNEPAKLNVKNVKNFRSLTSATGKVLNDDRSDWTEAWKLFPGEVAYVWHGERQCAELAEHFVGCGFLQRNLIVWVKNALVISRGHYHPQHESCWYFVRKGKTARWSGDRKQSTVWAINRGTNEFGHGTQKPIECMRRPMVNNSKAGDLVYDPFLGSGTTLIAGEMIGRRCLGLELDPGYCDVIVERWQNLTKREALLIGSAKPIECDGKPSFAAVKADRLGKDGGSAEPSPPKVKAGVRA